MKINATSAVLLLTLLTACQSISTPNSNSSPVTTQKAAPSPNPTADKLSSFDAELYLLAYPEVEKQLKEGKFSSALEHYQQVGQSSKDAQGEMMAGFFVGTGGNDTVTGFGKHPHLAGVKFEIVPSSQDKLPIRPQTLGRGEVDRLIGQPGSDDEFLLGSFVNAVNPKAEPFYVGNGEADYAKIENFQPKEDMIVLAGTPQQYIIKPEGKQVRILTASGDLIAIVDSTTRLTVGEVVKEYGIFIVK